MQGRGGSSRQCPNVRLDDLSTYEKIAFYKLVSRKELEGIADEGEVGRRRQVKRKECGRVRSIAERREEKREKGG